MTNPKGNIDTLKPYKSKWKSGATQTIRVPISLTKELIDIAKRLDNDEPIFESKSINVSSEIEQILNDPIVTRKGRDKSAIKRAFDALQTRLEDTAHNDY